MDVVVEDVVVLVEVEDVVVLVEVEEVVVEVEVVVDEAVDVVTADVVVALIVVVVEDVEIAASVEDVAVIELEEDEVNTVLDEAGAVVTVDAVESGDTLDDVVTTEPQPPAGAGILSSSCPECPCLVASSSTSMSTNLLSPAEWQIEIFCTPCELLGLLGLLSSTFLSSAFSASLSRLLFLVRTALGSSFNKGRPKFRAFVASNNETTNTAPSAMTSDSLFARKFKTSFSLASEFYLLLSVSIFRRYKKIGWRIFRPATRSV